MFGLGINVIIPCFNVAGGSPFSIDFQNMGSKNGTIFKLKVYKIPL